MPKFYTDAQCMRKANQHWDMAGLARQDFDRQDELRHTSLARKWERRAAEGGWQQPAKRQAPDVVAWVDESAEIDPAAWDALLKKGAQS